MNHFTCRLLYHPPILPVRSGLSFSFNLGGNLRFPKSKFRRLTGVRVWEGAELGLEATHHSCICKRQVPTDVGHTTRCIGAKATTTTVFSKVPKL